MKYALLFFLFLNIAFVSAQAPAQSPDKKAQRAYQLAGQAISARQYDKALVLLKEAVEHDDQFAAAWQQIGDINRRLQNYKEAVKSYQKVIQLNPEFHSLTYFGLAESQLNIGDYQNALLHLKKYTAYNTLSEKNKELANKLISDCIYSLAAVKDPVPYNPINLGPQVNSAQQEYLPVVTADEETLIYTRQSNKNEDFFRSQKQGKNWGTASSLSRNINTEAFNEGAQCISPDGMYLFFTGCNRPDGLGRCDIYVSRREGNDWSKPHNLGAPINGPGWETQPSLSADGRTLYFVSTRTGSVGGSDIWKSELRDGGEWSVPENLGPMINTSYDEQSPFIHPDNETLYFSSNGWIGLGNKDLFLSRKDASGKWQKPENLGYPINTFKEESSLTISTNGKTAFFASDKEGGFGGLDIYSFELAEKLRPKAVTYVKGIVVDKSTTKPLGAQIQMISVQNNQLVFDDSSDPETGQFLATMPVGKVFALNVAREGYLFYSENFTLNRSNSYDQPFNIRIPLQRIEIGGKVILRNIFFNTNEYQLLPESEVELKQLLAFLKVNPKITIEIGGHTDNVGNDAFNQSLSENRAKTVLKYLLEHKVDASRLRAKGFGETVPVADNDTAEGRQSNRRTEFRVIGVQ